MTLEILTPDKKYFDGEISSVTVPGEMGSFEVLSHHAPIISILDHGKITVRTASAKTQIFFIKGGVVEVLNDKVMLLAEGVEVVN